MVISFVCLVPVHLFLSSMAVLYHVNRELEQQRQRRLRKRHLKSEAALLQTLSRLFQLVQFVKCWKFFLELNSKRLYQSSESCGLVFTSSTKREIMHFHVLDVRAVTAKKCRKKRDARAGLLFSQSKPRNIAFLPFSLTSSSSLLKLRNN